MSTSAEEKRLWIRQVLPTDWSTTTVYGPQPPYATQACDSEDYSSACSCAGITEGLVTYLGTVSQTMMQWGNTRLIFVDRNEFCNNYNYHGSYDGDFLPGHSAIFVDDLFGVVKCGHFVCGL